MKALAAVFGFTLATLSGAEAPLPKFDSNAIGVPPLSLHESLKLATKPRSFAYTLPKPDDVAPSGWYLGPNTLPSTARIAPTPPRFTPRTGPWRMPVLAPNPNVDYKIVLKEPNPNIDPKMLIEVPGLDPKPGNEPTAP